MVVSKDFILLTMMTQLTGWNDTHTHTTVLLLFWNLSGTTRVSRYQKGKTRKVQPIWIYWSKR